MGAGKGEGRARNPLLPRHMGLRGYCRQVEARWLLLEKVAVALPVQPWAPPGLTSAYTLSRVQVCWLCAC